MEEKYCGYCKKMHPVKNFYAHANTADRLTYNCKEYYSENGRKHRVSAALKRLSKRYGTYNNFTI
jgi:hypothetical protein